MGNDSATKTEWPLFKARGPNYRLVLEQPYYPKEAEYDDRVDTSSGPQGHIAKFNMQPFPDEPALFYDVGEDRYYKTEADKQAVVDRLIENLKKPGEKHYEVYDRNSKKVETTIGELKDRDRKIAVLEEKLARLEKNLKKPS